MILTGAGRRPLDGEDIALHEVVKKLFDLFVAGEFTHQLNRHGGVIFANAAPLTLLNSY